MEIDTTMEPDIVPADPMETDVPERYAGEGRSNTDLIEHCDDSDSDSDPGSKWMNWRRSQFWYEIPGLRDIPDYRVPSSYPWEEEEKEKEKKGVYFLKVTYILWSNLSDNQRMRGRWDPADPHRRMVRSKSIAASPSSERVVDAEPQSECTSAEVLRVRMAMHECFEKGTSCRRLFKSEANKKDLHFHCVDDEPYIFFVNRCQHESAMHSYAHVFPKLNDVDPLISFEWVKPTTLEGDKQYLEFFPKLVNATEYGDTKDDVLAKAIVLAKKSFRKMLYFQINIAVQDCLELKETEARMNQRYSLYYFAVSEIVLNGSDCKSVLRSIRDGYSGLPFYLTEFDSYTTDVWEGVILDIVDYLVTHLRIQREQGLHKEWVCEKLNNDVVEFVCETVDEQLRLRSHLYVDFLKKKIRIAQECGIVTPQDIDLE
uniref:Uncharacterized protein n=1 Tax=Arundo donax TaxID=35708 RepID=A0A0A9BAX4_ARUDO